MASPIRLIVRNVFIGLLAAALAGDAAAGREHLPLPVMTPVMAVDDEVFVCAGSGRPSDPRFGVSSHIAGKATAAAASTTTGTLSALVIFAKFRGEATSVNTKPVWADDLFDANLPGSFTHFYREMSGGQLEISGSVLPTRYTSRSRASAYVADQPGTIGKFALFNLEILEQADGDVDMGQFDNDGPDGAPNSGDDDGYVDVVFINLLSVPRDFFRSGASGFGSLGLETDFVTDDAAAGGGAIRIRSRYSGFGGTTQRGHVFTVTAATMCHEFGHVLGLPDLYDQSSQVAGELDPEIDSAGIGRWGLMGLGTLGWGIENGPNAFCAWSLAQLGWLGSGNERLEVIEESRSDIVLEQIDRDGRVLKVPISRDEYFLIENRQASGSFYNREIPGRGLLLWHVDEWADNDEERHKRVDLVCADGLYDDAGFPGSRPNPVSGGDNLDFHSRDTAYNDEHNGNQGDATDPFDGIRFRRFAHDTNPGARAYSGASRGLPLGFALENIADLGDGRMSLDVLLRQPVPGNIAESTMWSGEIDVSGDVVVERGATLTIQEGTTVRFSTDDERGAGFDPDRCELVVYGDLVLPTGGATTSMISAATRPRGSDWLGVFLMDGQAPDVEAAIASGVLQVANSSHGVVRLVLPAGRTVWGRGRRVIPSDLIVPADAELFVEAGANVRFSAGDLSLRGRSPGLVELVIAGTLAGGGDESSMARFTIDSAGTDDAWYGITAQPGSVVDLSFTEIFQCLVALSGEVPEGATVRLTDSLIRRVFLGLLFNLFGELQVDGTRFEAVTSNAIQVRGTGIARIRGSTLDAIGEEGISSSNCNIEAIDVLIEGSGSRDAEDPRSGLIATGGRGQRIDLWRSTISDNTLYGLDLTAWQGIVEVHGSEISANKSHGVVAAGLERLVFEDNAVVRNLGHGAHIGDTVVEIWTTEFEDNIGSGLLLDDGATGVIEMSLFRNGTGLALQGLRTMILRSNRFENTAVGLDSDNSAPSLVQNRFDNNITAIRVDGGRIPVQISDNSFVGNTTAIQNLTRRVLQAQGNFWGTSDSSAIASQLEGQIEWTPFLDGEPGMTAVGEAGGPPLPERFAVHQNHPNPFNSLTVIPFDLPHDAIVEVTIYDVLGRRVRRLLSQRLAAGYHRLVWDGRDESDQSVGSGLYFYFFRADQLTQSGRMLLLQ